MPAIASAVASPSGAPLVWMTRSASGCAFGGVAKRQPSASAILERAGSMSISSTSAPGNLAASAAARQPTRPAPITEIRSPGPGTASHNPLTAVSILAASVARRSGTSAATSVAASRGTTNRSWWGCRQKTRRPSNSIGPPSTTPTAEYPYLTGAGNSPSWNGQRIRRHSLSGTSPRKTRLSVPLLMALTRLRINTSPDTRDRNGCVLISPRSGATTQNACASCTEITIEQRVPTEVESADPRANRLVERVATGKRDARAARSDNDRGDRYLQPVE